MEKKQLNLSARLLSARQYSSPLRSSTGEESKAESASNSFPANKCVGEAVKPGVVPFIWEQTPGRAKNSQVYTPEYKEPPTRFVSGELPLLRAQNRPSSIPVHDNKDSDSGSETYDATFSDHVLDQSYSMNCSTSGLSTSEFPIDKPCANFSITEVGNREFIMNRFLPAAKVMTLESPQYAPKRQIIAIEPTQLSKVIFPKIVKGTSLTPPENMAFTLYTSRYWVST